MTIEDLRENTENGSSIVSNITDEQISIADESLSIIEKKRRLEDVYNSGQWKDEDEYEIAKIRQVIRNHIFKQVKFVKGEGAKQNTKSGKKLKKVKVLELGKCHEKPDLSKQNGYECEIMRLVGMHENNSTITTRALWWKTYNSYVHHEIRQLRGRMNAGMKTSIRQGKLFSIVIHILWIIIN